VIKAVQRRRRLIAGISAIALAGLTVAAAQGAALGATRWTVYPTPQPGKNFAYQSRQFTDVGAASPGSAWAVGGYLTGQAGGRLLAHWNGRRWSAVPVPAPAGGIGALRWISVLSGTDAWAFGNQKQCGPGPCLWALRNTGRGWVTRTLPGAPQTIIPEKIRAFSDRSIWIAGYGATTSEPTAAHWNGSRWTTIPVPLPAGAIGGQLSDIAAVPGTAAAIGVGYAYNASRAWMVLTALWNGRSWSLLPAAQPRGGGQGWGLTVLSASDAWLVGASYPAGSGGSTFKALIERWDGSSWHLAATPGTAASTFLTGITASSASEILAVGYRYYPYRTLAELYNGRRWIVQPTVNPYGGRTNSDIFWAATRVPGTGQFWAVGEQGPARPGYGAEFTLAEHCSC
jgi:hypothetical protein